jgi:small subunit ribosomal protein S9
MNKLISNLNAIGIAKRKTSIAKIFLTPNLLLESSQIIINNKCLTDLNDIKYFNEFLNHIYTILNINLIYNLKIIVKGGGISSQKNAIKLAILKGFINLNLSFKSIFKRYNLIDNDSRIKERRKYGLKKARKASQYSKR